MDDQLLRATNENNEYFSALLERETLNFKRDMEMIREELDHERQSLVSFLRGNLSHVVSTDRILLFVCSHQADINKEQQSRSLQIEAQQLLHADIQTLSGALSAVEMELTQTKEQHKQQLLLMEHEKSRQEHYWSERLLQVQQEMAVQERNHEKMMLDRVNSMQSACDQTIASVREKQLSLIRAETESEKIRMMTEFRTQCELEIEHLRVQERTRHTMEIERLRESFLLREKETAADLVQLEKLHRERIKQLEKERSQEARKNEILLQEQAQSTLSFQRKIEELQHALQLREERESQLILQHDATQREFNELIAKSETKQQQEADYRSELSRALTELRLLQAEREELHNQSSHTTAQGMQWRKLLAEYNDREQQLQTSLRIAREEIVFNEHECERLRSENAVLLKEKEKHERLIYGVSQSQTKDKKRTVTVIESERDQPKDSLIQQSNRSSSLMLNSSIQSASLSFSPSSLSFLPGQVSYQLQQTPLSAVRSTIQATTNNLQSHSNNSIMSNLYGTNNLYHQDVKASPGSFINSGSNQKQTTSPTNHTSGTHITSVVNRSLSPSRLHTMTISSAAKLPVSQTGFSKDPDVQSMLSRHRQLRQ
jgi:hypothetical protein